MKQLFVILTKLLQLVGELLVIFIKFLIFLLISPLTVIRCLPRVWKYKSIRAGWEKFTWIWGAYWNHFNL